MSKKVGIQGHTAGISFDEKPTEKELAYSKGFRDGLEHAAKICDTTNPCDGSGWDMACTDLAEQIRREVK